MTEAGGDAPARGVIPAPLLLAIETTGSRCSAVAARGTAILAAEARDMRYGHGEALLPMIDRVTAAAGLQPRELDVVAVATGPGGFTGIRVGLAAAHGIALAGGAQLVGVSSFAAVAVLLSEMGHTADERAVLVALDSRRADLYVQLFASGTAPPLTPPQAILPDALAAFVESIGRAAPLLVAGDAAVAAAAVLPGATVVPDTAPDARGVAAAALRQLGEGEAPAPVQPLYLRPPDVTLPKRLLAAHGK